MSTDSSIPAYMAGFQEIFDAYVDCALWSCSIGEDFAAEWATHDVAIASDVSLESFGFTADDIASESLASMRADLESFLSWPEHWDAVSGSIHEAALDFWAAELGYAQIGHDFWLTRNGHGAGFWDRFAVGEGAAYGKHLTEMAKPYEESDLYVGDDGKVYVS